MSNPLSSHIDYRSDGASQVNSTQVKALTAVDHVLVVDSIFISNTTANDLLLNVTVTLQRADPQAFSFVKELSLTAFSKAELVQNACLYLQPSDSISIETDSADNYVDVLFSYRELIS